MTTLVIHAAWTLTAAFALSLLYELYRATAKAGVSEHDSMRVFLREGIPVYGIAALVIAWMFTGGTRSAWAGLVFAIVAILVSIFYYNPHVMVVRRPTTLDWIEDLVFTGLLFVAVTQLAYALLGVGVA